MEESGCAWKCGAFVFGQMDMLADEGLGVHGSETNRLQLYSILRK